MSTEPVTLPFTGPTPVTFYQRGVPIRHRRKAPAYVWTVGVPHLLVFGTVFLAVFAVALIAVSALVVAR